MSTLTEGNDEYKKVFVVVVTYNGSKWLKKCLDTLVSSDVQVSIIVVDNGSTDSTQNIIKDFPEIEFIQSNTNLGFGKANNKGMQIAFNEQCDYIFLLNQDAWIEPGTITTLLKVAEKNRDYGIISPVHLNGTYSGLDLNFSKQLAPENCPSFYSDMYVNKFQQLYEIKFVNAAAWFISRSCIERTGLFEPFFFLYGEDNNYLQRVSFHGFKVGITPLCTICHDREIRQGNFSDSRRSVWERTQSLITLLNILNSYSKSIMIFIKDRLLQILKYIFEKKIGAIKYPLKEIFFFLANCNKLRKIRNYHKLPGNIR